MFFKTLLGRFSTTAASGGLEPWEDGYSIARSMPDGRFTVFVLDATWKVLSDEGGFTLEDLRELPERVHAACENLGLLRQTPRQFFLEFGPLDHPTANSATVRGTHFLV